MMLRRSVAWLPLGAALALMIALAPTAPGVASTPVSSPEASPAASCEGVSEYLTRRSRILLDRATIFAQGANPGALSAAGARKVSEAFAEAGDEIAKLDPPPVLADYHETSIAGFEALSATYLAIAEHGLAGASDALAAQREPVDAMVAAEEEAMAICGDAWVTVEDLQATPAA
jgi:hypothetical protein